MFKCTAMVPVTQVARLVDRNISEWKNQHVCHIVSIHVVYTASWEVNSFFLLSALQILSKALPCVYTNEWICKMMFCKSYLLSNYCHFGYLWVDFVKVQWVCLVHGTFLSNTFKVHWAPSVRIKQTTCEHLRKKNLGFCQKDLPLLKFHMLEILI